MGHLKLFEEFVNIRRSSWDISEASDPSRINEILDAIKNTDIGKLLQRLLKVEPVGTGTYFDFDRVFQPVKTGRVYIKGSYGAKTRIYYDDKSNKWVQESEASGKIYGASYVDTLEDILKFSVTRLVSLNVELGIDKKDLAEWMNSNWPTLYTLSSIREILDEYKKGTGKPLMITDYSVIPSLPSYKQYGPFFNFNLSGRYINIDLNPLKIDDENMTGIIEIKLTNRKGYSLKFVRGSLSSLEIGVDSLEELDKKFLQGVTSYIKKIYEGSGYNPIICEAYLKMLEGNIEALRKVFLDLYKTEPLRFSKYLKSLQSYDANLAKSISQEIGEEDTEDLRKGSSLLGKFGIE